MFRDWTYEEATKVAKQLIEIGEAEIYLSKGPYPWNLATSCEPGGSHRLDIYTSVWFRATDPKTGLDFRWTFNIEPRSANGKGIYEIDVKGCMVVLAMLPDAAKKSFQDYLSECADKVEKHAEELQQYVNKERHTVDSLRTAARGK